MEYNSARTQLVIPEYGRNVQRMIEYAKELPTREERTTAAKTIITAMSVLNPQIREMTDYKHKLWDHLFVISDFKLDCESPYPMPEQDIIHTKPKRVPYPQKNIKYRHYGSILENVINEVKVMEEGADKKALTDMVANFMKHLYLTYNRDAVNDDVIFEQLKKMSGGLLEVSEGVKLSAVYIEPKDYSPKKNKRPQPQQPIRNRNNGSFRRK